MKAFILFVAWLLLLLVIWKIGWAEGEAYLKNKESCKKACGAYFWNYNCPDECDELLADQQNN